MVSSSHEITMNVIRIASCTIGREGPSLLMHAFLRQRKNGLLPKDNAIVSRLRKTGARHRPKHCRGREAVVF